MPNIIDLLDRLLMAAGLSIIVVFGVIAAFSIVSELKRDHWRKKS